MLDLLQKHDVGELTVVQVRSKNGKSVDQKVKSSFFCYLKKFFEYFSPDIIQIFQRNRPDSEKNQRMRKSVIGLDEEQKCRKEVHHLSLFLLKIFSGNG